MTTGHIDYREAFVIEAELASHSWTCKTCSINAVYGRVMDCPQYRHMKEYCERAYEVLPPYYKDRYDKAAQIVQEATARAFGAA